MSKGQNSPERTKFQKGEERYILRSQIREAEYNPRVIGEGAEKRLRKAIKEIGLLGTIIWNERTGTVVSGHQRLRATDALEGYPEKVADYEIRVTAVSLSERDEKRANVILNNPSVQGEWDTGLLGELMEGSGIAPDEMGFTTTDMAMLFDGDPRFTQLFEDTKEVAEAKDKIRDIRDSRDAAMDKMQAQQSADFFFTAVFQTQADKDRFLMAMGVPVNEQYVNGAILARRCGVETDGPQLGVR